MLEKELKKLLPNNIFLLNIYENSQTNCLKVTIDSSSGVDIKTTAKVSKIIKNSDLFKNAYPSGIRLEVSSPSIFDSLQEPFQFKKNIGKRNFILFLKISNSPLADASCMEQDVKTLPQH